MENSSALIRHAIRRLISKGNLTNFSTKLTQEEWRMAREACAPNADDQVIGDIQISTIGNRLRYGYRDGDGTKVEGNIELMLLTDWGLARILYELVWFLTGTG